MPGTEMEALGLPELIVIAVVALLLFGPNRIPEIGRELGEGVRAFKQALHARSQERHNQPEEPPLAGP